MGTPTTPDNLPQWGGGETITSLQGALNNIGTKTQDAFLDRLGSFRTHQFATVTAMDAWTTANPTKVNNGDEAFILLDGAIYRRTGGAWMIPPPNSPFISYYRANALAVPTSTSTSVPALITDVANTSLFTNVGGVFTCQQAGWYVTTFNVLFASNSSGVRRLTISNSRPNVEITGNDSYPGGSGAFYNTVVTRIQPAGIGDTVTPTIWQTSGGNLDATRIQVSIQQIQRGL